MTKRPHDRTDLLLAPVALDVDARLRDLGQLTLSQLKKRVAFEANHQPPATKAEAEACLVAAVEYLVDLQGWKASLTEVGLTLTHGTNAITLAVPPVFLEYVGATTKTAAAS